MEITNLPSGVGIHLFSPQYIGADYLIYKLDVFGCRAGILECGKIENTCFTKEIKDGRYEILVSKDFLPTEQKEFTVYSNYLCEFVNKFLKVICCECCEQELGKSKDTKIDELFFDAFVNFNCLGLFNDLKLTQNTSCKDKTELAEKKEISQFYGTFNFNYSDKKKELLATMYIDLYKQSVNALKCNEKDLECINNLFQIDKVEKCLYKQGIDLTYLTDMYDKLNCKNYE